MPLGCKAKRRDVSDFCVRKKVRLGLGLQGETLGRLEILLKKKGKVRVRVTRQNFGTSQTFASEKG